MGIYDNTLYAGDGSSNSYAWKILQNNIYNDDGDAISSEWTTKDFTFDAPAKFKVFSDLWLEADSSTGTTLSVGYAKDRSPSFKFSSVDLWQTSHTINARVPIFDGYDLGKYFKFKFSNAQKDQNFKVHSLTGWYSLQPMRLDN